MKEKWKEKKRNKYCQYCTFVTNSTRNRSSTLFIGRHVSSVPRRSDFWRVDGRCVAEHRCRCTTLMKFHGTLSSYYRGIITAYAFVAGRRRKVI